MLFLSFFSFPLWVVITLEQIKSTKISATHIVNLNIYAVTLCHCSDEKKLKKTRRKKAKAKTKSKPKKQHSKITHLLILFFFLCSFRVVSSFASACVFGPRRLPNPNTSIILSSPLTHSLHSNNNNHKSFHAFGFASNTSTTATTPFVSLHTRGCITTCAVVCECACSSNNTRIIVLVWSYGDTKRHLAASAHFAAYVGGLASRSITSKHLNLKHISFCKIVLA